jgi:hypothetical protein
LCLLKGVDIIDQRYSLIEINEAIDQLENFIESDEKLYKATIDSRRMGITIDDINWYMEELDKQEQNREMERRKKIEDENPTLISLRQKNQLKEIEKNKNDNTVGLTIIYRSGRDEIPLTINVSTVDRYREQPRWVVKYSWFDPVVCTRHDVVWNPRHSDINCPGWFPQHWQSKKIEKKLHMAYYVAWKFATGKARTMGIVPRYVKASSSLKVLEDL